MEIIRQDISALTPYKNNARTHSASQIEKLCRSLNEFGFTNPVLVDKDGGIIAGHGRVLAAAKMGMEKVPTICLDHLTDAQKRAYIIADNQLALDAGWDNELLALELGELKGVDFDLSLIGFDADELSSLLGEQAEEGLTDPDDVPPIPVEPRSKPGDVWLMGQSMVMCGDSCSASDWDTLMGGGLADIVWTDPPYNVNFESKIAGKIKNDDMSDQKFREFLTEAYMCLYTVMKPGAAIYVAHADTEGLNFRTAFNAAGLKLSGCLVWRKNAMVMGRSDYQWQHEPILYGWKPGAAHRWYGGRKNTTIVSMGEDSPFVLQDDGRYCISIGDSVFTIPADAVVEEHPSSIFYHEKPKRSSEHPTMKPVALVERMLKNNSKPGDLVVDAFGGSGTTLISAIRLGMNARVMELDPKYCDVIVKRWQEYTGKTATLLLTGEEFGG